MTDSEIDRSRRSCCGSTLAPQSDRAKIVAEIEPKRAVAVIERSRPHFHREMTEVYRILRGTPRRRLRGT